MDLQLQDKVALISGSTAGIGYAIAAGLAAEGTSVIINGRTEERVKQAIATLQQRNLSGEIQGIAADLSQIEEVEKVVHKFPQVDILVNNLGIYDFKPFDSISDAEWQNFFEVNILSGVRLSRAYLPGMRDRNWGRIIFISSESAINIPTEMMHYGMTKTAQLSLSRGLAKTTKGTKITRLYR